MTESPNPVENRDIAFEMRGIVKRFPGVLANDHVDFSCQVGSVHALLGENGAGKSTLMNVLAGLYHPEGGEIFIGGKRVSLPLASGCNCERHWNDPPAFHARAIALRR